MTTLTATHARIPIPVLAAAATVVLLAAASSCGAVDFVLHDQYSRVTFSRLIVTTLFLVVEASAVITTIGLLRGRRLAWQLLLGYALVWELGFSIIKHALWHETTALLFGGLTLLVVLPLLLAPATRRHVNASTSTALAAPVHTPLRCSSLRMCGQMQLRRQPAVHRTIVVVDVAGFGDQRRANPQQIVVRDGLYRVLEQAFLTASVEWADCYREDRGDGVFILAAPDIPKSRFVELLPMALTQALSVHNRTRCAAEQIRLRVALHAGEVNFDDHGVTAAAINLTFRLLDTGHLKKALVNSPGMLALIVSSWFFDEVVRHSPIIDPTTYHPIRVSVKETRTVGWICLPDPLSRPVKGGLVQPVSHCIGQLVDLRCSRP